MGSPRWRWHISSELLEGVHRGDPAAVDELFELFRVKLPLLVESNLRYFGWGYLPPEFKEDLVNDVLISLFEHLPRELSGPEMSGFVSTVARRRVSDTLTRIKKSPSLLPRVGRPSDEDEGPQVEPAHDPGGEIEDALFREDLLEALRRNLKGRPLEVFLLHYIERQTPEQIGERLAITPANVYVQLNAIRKTAREVWLGPETDPGGGRSDPDSDEH